MMLPCVGLHVFALCWCSAYLTDGFIPKQQLSKLLGVWQGDGGPDALVCQLISAGLWEERKGGYEIHDYLEYNPSKRQTLQRRKNRAIAGRAGGLAKAASKRVANAYQKSAPSPSPSPSPEELSSPVGEEAVAVPRADRNGFDDWPEDFQPIKTRIQTVPFLTKHQKWLSDLGWWKAQDERFENIPAYLDALLAGATAYIVSVGYSPRSKRGLLQKLHNCMEVEAKKVERETRKAT
jgi:hypothetical protein